MRINETGIDGAYRIVPDPIPDRRGRFYEAWRIGDLTRAIGHPFDVRQVNVSVSRRRTLRGIHTTTVPPGQAKLVTCVRGAALDVAVDLRVGSPTFGAHAITVQDGSEGVGVYMADGIGHAFLALTDDTCMNYICSEEYVPGTMIDVDALDPDLGIDWRLDGEPIRSDKDAAAPGLRQALADGILPTLEQCAARDADLAGAAR